MLIESPPSKLADHANEIERVFGAATVPGIEARLRDSTANWAPIALRAMEWACPLSLHCTLAAIRRARRCNCVWEALTYEYRFVWHALERRDFAEGIRAAVIDKDRKPQWTQTSTHQISLADVAAMFAPLGEHELKERATN